MTDLKADPAGFINEGGGQKELKDRVIDSGLCTGCGACVGLCPYQTVYQDRTVVLHACDLENGRCYAVCPRITGDLEALRRGLFSENDYTPELGALKGFFITRAADRSGNRRVQHGGTVTALVKLALDEGLIDTAVLAEEGEGLLPRSVAVADPVNAGRLGGSRFVVSPTVAEFNRISLGSAGMIGVVATPCQALALAKMRKWGHDAASCPHFDGGGTGIEKLHLVIGLFCGWALSWKKLSALLSGKTDTAKITGMDIPPSRYHTLEVYTDAQTIQVSLDEVTPCVRESCLSCGDMTAEFSDLSVGSARLPEGWETARSWNQVIVRTGLGMELLELARNRGVLEFREVPEGNLEKLKAASMGKKQAAE